jgi:hypothetical protein
MINPLTIMFEISLMLAEFGENFWDFINVGIFDFLFVELSNGIDTFEVGELIFDSFQDGLWLQVQDVILDTINFPIVGVFLNVYVLAGLLALRFIKLYVPILGA